MRQLPWRAAPRAALSSPLTMIVAAITTLLACFLGSAAVLHASAAGGATVTYQGQNVCPDAYGPVFSRVDGAAATAPAVIATVQRQAAAHGYGQPVTAMYSKVLYGSEYNGVAGYRTRLAYRDGALDQLQLRQGTRAPGLWMGRDLGEVKRIGLGTVGHVQGRPLPPVSGIYTDLYNPPPRWWCSQQDTAVQNRLVDGIETGSVLFATDRATFERAIGDLGLANLAQLSMSFYQPPPATLAEAQEQVSRADALIADVQADLARQGLANTVGAGVPFERSVQIAEQAQTNVLLSILPLAVISVLVGCAGVGTVALQWYQRRYPQLRLLCARGSGPPALAGLAVAELGLPVLAGAVAGTVLARLLLGFYAPPGAVSTTGQVLAAAVAGVVLLVALGLLAGVVALRTHREFQLGRVRGRGLGWRILGAFPWELVTAGLAVLGWSRLVDYGRAGKIGNPLPQVDPVALTYPVLVVLTVGLLAARVLWVLLHVSHRARFWSHPALQLAIRRLAGARAPVTGVLVIGVLAIGTLAAGNGIAGGQRAALEVKSGLFVGGNTRIDTESRLGTGAVALPAELRGSSTMVGELTGTGSVVLVVDPGTLRQAAALGTLDPDAVDELLGRLGPAVPGGLPAIRIGHTPAQSAALPGLPSAVPVGDLPSFPMIGTKPGYVISRAALAPAQLAAIPKWSVVSSASMDQVSSALGAAGLAQPNRLSRATALDALPFYVVEWTFSFVIVLGSVLGVVAVLALLVAVEVRRRQNALAGNLLLRMGMRPRALFGSHLLEHGALAGLATVTGVACGVAVAGISVPRFDPATFLAPRSALPDPTLFILGALVTALVVAGLAGVIAVRSVRGARTAELIRA